MRTFAKQQIGSYVMSFTIVATLAGCSGLQQKQDQVPSVPGPIRPESKPPQIEHPLPNHFIVKIEPTSPIPTREKEEEVKSGSVPQRDKIAYLTFDDGPSRNTRKILGILKSFNISATFFVLGSDSNESKSLYKQIAAEGHVLGNHTYSHNYKKIYQSPEAFREDVRKLDQLLENTVGYRPDILRFPGGSNNHVSWKSGGKRIMKKITQAMKEDGYQYFDWNVSSTDAATVQSKDLIIQSVLRGSRGKKNIIVLMHDVDNKITTVEALPTVIKGLKEAGFRFEKLSKSAFTFQFLKP